MTISRTMLAPIHLAIMFPGFEYRSGAGRELAQVFSVAGHVVAAHLVHLVVAVGLGSVVDEIMVHVSQQ